MINRQRARALIAVGALMVMALTLFGCGSHAPDLPAADVVFTLETALVEGRMAFVGASGAIEGTINPDLIVNAGDTVQLVIVNADGMPHDIMIPEFDVQTVMLTAKRQVAEVTFVAGQTGVFEYHCAVSGHRQSGMEGKLIVTGENG